MIWQDMIISIVSFSFGFMIVPQIIDSFKGKSYINMVTAILTVVGLLILGFTFATMNMWISTTANMSTCLMWIILTILSLKNYLRKRNANTIIRTSNGN
jgi:uncharacterized membrane protein AbrB (regulator of aidB expression)